MLSPFSIQSNSYKRRKTPNTRIVDNSHSEEILKRPQLTSPAKSETVQPA